MTRHPLLLFVGVVILLCSVVGGLFWAAYNGGAPEPAEPAQAMAAQAMELHATATGTPSPVPTPDYSGAYAIQTQAEAASNLAQAQQRIANAEATIAAAVATHAEGTRSAPYNSMLQGTPTAVEMTRVAVVGTEQARGTESSAQRAAYFAGVQATQEAEADAERRKTNRDDALFYASVLTICASVLTIIGAIVYRVNLNAWRKTAGDAADDLLGNLQEPTDMERAFIPVAPGTSHTSRLPVDDATFAEWARRMLAGETAGINKWEKASSPFYGKRDGYIPFLDEMERRGYIAEVTGRGKILSDTGRRFCDGWLARKGYGSPPPAAKAPESPEGAMKSTMPCLETPLTEGEGQERTNNEI